MQRCQEREAREEGAQENTALLSKGASLPFLSLQALLFVTGHGIKTVEDRLHAGAGI